MVKHKKKRWLDAQKVFVILLLIIVVLSALSIAKFYGLLIPELPQTIVHGNTVYLDSMSLETKIAQMVVVIGDRRMITPWKNMHVGGIHMYTLPTEYIFNNTVIDFQYNQKIPFFVTSDLEGCFNPFSRFRNFTAASEVTTLGDAFEKGFFEGEYLKSLGINLNFAPVVDLNDSIWKCRAFPGDVEKISKLANSYVLGLQSQGILATAKHYPGKTLVVKDPHKFVVGAEISNDDILPYGYLYDKGGIKAIMVSHLITTGSIDSQGVPSVVSPKVIQDIKDQYPGILVISDEIHMLGLRNFYQNIDEVYIAVFKAGNDVVLNFDRDPNEIYRMIQIIRDAVARGEISESQIDESVTKILKVKGFNVA